MWQGRTLLGSQSFRLWSAICLVVAFSGVENMLERWGRTPEGRVYRQFLPSA